MVQPDLHGFPAGDLHHRFAAGVHGRNRRSARRQSAVCISAGWHPTVSLDRLIAKSRELYPAETVIFAFVDDDEPKILVTMAPSWDAFNANRKSSHWIKFDSHTGQILNQSKPFNEDGPSFLGTMLSLHRDLLMARLPDPVCAHTSGEQGGFKKARRSSSSNASRGSAARFSGSMHSNLWRAGIVSIGRGQSQNLFSPSQYREDFGLCLYNNLVQSVHIGAATPRTMDYDGGGNIITDTRDTTVYHYSYNNRNRLASHKWSVFTRISTATNSRSVGLFRRHRQRVV